MLVENATSPWGQSWERVFQDCPHGEISHFQMDKERIWNTERFENHNNKNANKGTYLVKNSLKHVKLGTLRKEAY